LDYESINYFRERERVEREAAGSAKNAAARRAHEELARGYAALVRRTEPASRSAAAE
jgi:hypothetical protein